MTEAVEQLKRILNYVEAKIDNIEQISLEQDDYNELYLSLKEAQNGLIRTVRAQVAIEKNEARAKEEDEKEMQVES